MRQRVVYSQIRIDPDHPIAKMSGFRTRTAGRERPSVYLHKYVLYEKLGPGPHPCHWCGEPLNWKPRAAKGSLLADHLNGDHSDNRPENLVPACNGCNIMRARKTFRPAIDADEQVVIAKDGLRTRAADVVCEICGVTFLASLTRIRKGTVTVCSKSCAGVKGSRSRWHS